MGTADGNLLLEALVRGVYARPREDELADFHHPSVGRFEVVAQGQGYKLRAAGSEVTIQTYATIDFGDVTLHCTVLRTRRAGSGVPGACPRCETPLRPAEMGAAYRTVATDRQECPFCHVQILGVRSARDTLGAAKTTGGSWVHVESNMACPQCLGAMTPATLRVGHTEVSVEACTSCERVLLEPEDRRALEVAAQGLPK